MTYKQSKPLEDGTILLFKNEEQRNDKDPKYKGHGKAGGVDVWASGWINESREGKTYMKIKLQPKQERRRDDYERGRDDARSVRGEPF